MLKKCKLQNEGCQKSLPLYPEIYDQVIDLPVEKSPLILITEKESPELKSGVGYRQAMQKLLKLKSRLIWEEKYNVAKMTVIPAEAGIQKR